MHPKIAAQMGTQRGLLLRRQALAAGLTEEQIARLVRSGEWVVVRRGVYATGVLWASLDDRQGRPLLRAWAASLNMSMPHVLSHESAALAHGMQILRPRPWNVHVTRFGVVGCRSRHGVCHHQAPFTPGQIIDVEGVPTLNMARTAIDIARSHGQKDGLRYGLVACDSARRAGVTLEELQAALDPMENWPNVTVGRTSAELSDPGADSLIESLGRLMVVGLGLGEVQTQFGFRADGRTAWVDLRVGRHLIECDGKWKYIPVADGGLADRNPGLVVWDEKKRQEWLCSYHLGMSRLDWDDVMPAGWMAAEARLLKEILETERRWGSDISDLAPYIIREPRRRRS